MGSYQQLARTMLKHVPDAERYVGCPHCGKPWAVWQMVIHLNDQVGWSREEIADWLDHLGLDLAVHPEPVRPDWRRQIEYHVKRSPFITSIVLVSEAGTVPHIEVRFIDGQKACIAIPDEVIDESVYRALKRVEVEWDRRFRRTLVSPHDGSLTDITHVTYPDGLPVGASPITTTKEKS